MYDGPLPKIVKKSSIALNLYPGTYYYCNCGLSQDQPFCDDSHQGTDFSPKKFRIDEPKQVHLCQCKHTKKAPYCDGAHRLLDNV